MFQKPWILCVTLLGGLLLGENTASAQGLIWKLPEDGTWVEYEGEYSQIDFRPNSAQGDLKPEPWKRLLKISSVGQEMAEYNGKMQQCRWIELDVVTGRLNAGVIDPGPAGSRIYKVLVPESKVISNTTDQDGIPVSIIPIVKGYRKIGEGDVKLIPLDKDSKSGVLQIYPVISLLRHYKTLDSASDQPVDAEIGIPDVTAKRSSSIYKMESLFNRSTHTAAIWRSDDVPFGLARWEVKVLREEKGSTEPRTAFNKVSEFSIKMKARETGSDAQSKIAEQ